MPMCGFDKQMLDGLDEFNKGLIEAVLRISRREKVTVEEAIEFELQEMNIFLKELVIFGNDASKQQLIGIATYSIGFYKGSIELAKNKGIKIEEAMNIEIKKTRDFLCDIDKHYYEHLKGKTAHPMKELVSWMQSQEEN